MRQSVAQVLRTLVESYDFMRGASVPLNKFQIEKRSRIRGRQTIHNVIRSLRLYGWVDVRRKEWRRGRESDHYVLTDEGLYFAGELNIDLKDEIKERLGSKYHELQERFREARIRSADPVLSQICDVLARGGPPDFQWTFTITTDGYGRPRWQWRSEALVSPPSAQESILEPTSEQLKEVVNQLKKGEKEDQQELEQILRKKRSGVHMSTTNKHDIRVLRRISSTTKRSKHVRVKQLEIMGPSIGSERVEDVREKLYGYRRDEQGRIVKRRQVQVGEGG